MHQGWKGQEPNERGDACHFTLSLLPPAGPRSIKPTTQQQTTPPPLTSLVHFLSYMSLHVATCTSPPSAAHPASYENHHHDPSPALTGFTGCVRYDDEGWRRAMMLLRRIRRQPSPILQLRYHSHHHHSSSPRCLFRAAACANSELLAVLAAVCAANSKGCISRFRGNCARIHAVCKPHRVRMTRIRPRPSSTSASNEVRPFSHLRIIIILRTLRGACGSRPIQRFSGNARASLSHNDQIPFLLSSTDWHSTALALALRTCRSSQ